MPQTANTKGKQSGFPSPNADAPTPSPQLQGNPGPGSASLLGMWVTAGLELPQVGAGQHPGCQASPGLGSGAGRRGDPGERGEED